MSGTIRQATGARRPSMDATATETSGNAGPPSRLRLALVVPIFEDFVSFMQLCREIDARLTDWNAHLTIIGVDDGSLQSSNAACFDPPLTAIARVRLVKLRCNLGHQRAIAIGLVEAMKVGGFDAVLVADSDGEDRPADMARLISEHRARRDAVVVARRSKRSEGLRFRAFYAVYKAMFRTFTGKKIDFGNFVLLPCAAADRLTHMTETWNHLAAAILRSRLPLAPVGCERGTRYAGFSSMNLASLLIHGLSAVSVFSDVVLARMLVASSAVTILALLAAATATIIRLTTTLAVPGWATSVVGISVIILLQALLFSVISSLTMLRHRSALSFVPTEHAHIFAGERVTLFEASSLARVHDDNV